MPRLAALALRAAADEIRADLRSGATWADAHIAQASRETNSAIVVVDTSIGFGEARHPNRGKSPKPPTVIVAVAKSWKGAA